MHIKLRIEHDIWHIRKIPPKYPLDRDYTLLLTREEQIKKGKKWVSKEIDYLLSNQIEKIEEYLKKIYRSERVERIISEAFKQIKNRR